MNLSNDIIFDYRSAITIFPQRESDPKRDFRVWNLQLISYAGYLNAETSKVIGDPLNVEFTQVGAHSLKISTKYIIIQYSYYS